MAKINIAGIISGVENALKAVNELMPVAEKLGLPAAIANVSTIAIAAIAVAHNVIDRASELKEGLATEDETKLRGLISELQAVNDRLAGEIAAENDAATGGTGSGAS